MGCFNVACSISSLSICSGTKVYYIPLLKKHFKHKRYMAANFPEGYGWFHQPTNSLCYVNDVFDPISLPIKGVYNDYGSLEEIERDESVIALEKFFGISIESIISCGHCSKDITNFTGEVATSFYMHKEWHDPFNSKYIENIGFKFSSEEDCFTHPHIKNARLKVIPEKLGEEGRVLGLASYVIYNQDYDILEERDKVNSASEYLMKDFYKHFGYYINILNKDQRSVDILLNTSGMFIHGDIYEYMSQKGYIESWSGEKTCIGQAYDEYVEQVSNYMESKILVEGALGKDETLFELRKMMRMVNPFSSLDHGDFVSFIKDWAYLEEVYKDIFCQGQLKKEFIAYCSFYNEMILMNRFLFPACNGLQHGNPFSSKRLLEKSLEIVNAEIEENRKEYDCEEEDYDESSHL